MRPMSEQLHSINLLSTLQVKDYIEFFGGDPTRITIMGQGSGGSAASVMALSSEGRSNHGVVALSGTALSPGTVRSEPDKHARQLAKHTGCPETPVERLVLCLRKMSVDKIVQVCIINKSLFLINITTLKKSQPLQILVRVPNFRRHFLTLSDGH